MLDEDLDRPCLGTSGSSSLASSTLTAPGLEDAYFPPAGPSAHPAADDGPALMTGPSLPPTGLGPATSSGPGSYVEIAFGAAEPSASEIYSFTFSPGTTNASSFGPEPLQFGSDSVFYSFVPWISPDEPSALFSQGPIFLFVEPELADSRPLAFSGATNGNEPNGSNERNGGGSVNIEPGPRENDPRMGPGPTSFGNGSFPNHIGPGPHSYDARMGPGPISFGPGPYMYNPTSGPDTALQNTTIGPGPRSFGPGPHVYDNTTSGPESTNYHSIIGPGPISFRPGPVLGPHAPSMTVELTSVKIETCKRFLCGPCSMGFDRIEHLERHEVSNYHVINFAAEGMPLNRPLSPVFFCPMCDQSFSRQDNLRPHLLRHMGKGPRARLRQVSIDESIRMGLQDIDPRLHPLIPDPV